MSSNFLEQLVSEWYSYKGYFVRQNVLVGKRTKGGYDCELDVVAFNPETKHLVHVEPSMDCYSWGKRERRYLKKFEAGKKHIPTIFKGTALPAEIEQIALLEYASNTNRDKIGGGKVWLVKEFLKKIKEDLEAKRINTNAISEHTPLLRMIQFMCHYHDFIYPERTATNTQSRGHRTGTGHDSKDKRQANIAAYYLSKFNHTELKIGNQIKTLIQIAKQLGVKMTTLRNARDLFDPHTGSHRRGWRDSKGNKMPLSPQYAKIHSEFKDYPEIKLRQVVLRLIKAV
ncbi:MAG: hypothetical protein Q7R35_02530 [Elusimicrobiota bacterium]|nr:hypothetical protein [Elusimicrobiota bacterium]